MILVIIHVLGVLTMCVLQRENLVRAMITGRKRDRGD
jgi:cytochrome b